MATSLLHLLASLASLWLASQLVGAPEPGSKAPPSGLGAFEQYLSQLRLSDKCGTIYTSKAHGYDVQDFLVQTSDRYELHLHRIVHPEDFAPLAAGAARRRRKPYLLVHGLIGTSASFVTNVDELYRAPGRTFDATSELVAVLSANRGNYQYEWQSSAERAGRASHHEQKPKYPKRGRQFSDSLKLEFESDHMVFARDFRQAYKKFQLPANALEFSTNSLAFSLANFGYDVWLINLRGNHYSRRFNGPLSAERAEYWDFNIETIIKEDLAASIKFIARHTQQREHEPMGLVAYSYSAAHVMGLLTKFPKYLQQLRPIVMLAPTLLTASEQRGKFKFFMKLANSLVSKNGPFPTWGRAASGAQTKGLSLQNLDARLEHMACNLPVASKLCRLLETIIHGKSKQVTSVRGLLTNSRASALMQRDIDCGQTSKQILHQIMENLSAGSISPSYKPFVPAKQSYMPAAGTGARPARPSLMIIHSDSDSIATPSEVFKIRDTALKTLTLADVLIREPNFGHTDFLFSRRNQYLVNAEVVRMAVVHDHLTDLWDNPPRGPVGPHSHGR